MATLPADAVGRLVDAAGASKVSVQDAGVPPDPIVRPWAPAAYDVGTIGSFVEVATYLRELRGSSVPLGDEEPRRGALRLAWRDWADFVDRCAACGGEVLGHGGGGLFSIGDLIGSCAGCGASFLRPTRGFHVLVGGMAWVLRDSPWRWASVGYGQRLTLLPASLSRSTPARVVPRG